MSLGPGAQGLQRRLSQKHYLPLALSMGGCDARGDARAQTLVLSLFARSAKAIVLTAGR